VEPETCVYQVSRGLAEEAAVVVVMTDGEFMYVMEVVVAVAVAVAVAPVRSAKMLTRVMQASFGSDVASLEE
jgi:hypothetical protein